MKPWAGYVRVSHVGGREGDRFHSPDDQEREIRAWVKARGDNVVILPHELGESGGREDRPILNEAIQGIEQGRYCGLVVAYLSRASRSLKHTLEIYDRIERAGGQVVAIAENLDTTSVDGRLNRNLRASIDESERERHGERFARLRRDSTARGIWQRRQTPLGYAKDENTRKLVPDGNAGKVRKAFADRGSGKSISALARDLGMTGSGTRALLRNRVYLGELKVGEHINPTAHPALIDEDTWLAAQHTVAARPARSGQPVALLAGIVRCQSCGHIMSRSHGGKNTLTYACHGRHSAGRCPQPAAINMQTLDGIVTALALDELAAITLAGSDDGLISEDRRALKDAERELSVYLEGVTAAGLAPGQFADGATIRRVAVETARLALTERMASRKTRIDGDPVKAWERMDGAQRNRLLRSLVEAVVVRPAGRGKRVDPLDRTRIIKHGAGLVFPYAGGGGAMPIGEIPFPDRGDPVLLGV